MKILIVDDCEIVRATLAKKLKTWGFEPVKSSCGNEALEVLSDVDAPRLLIVDWMMPEMTGPELIAKIREQDPDRGSYVIMLTARTGAEDLETAFKSGADDYLPKPIVEEELYRRIREGQNILERQDQVIDTLNQFGQATSNS